ncbi:glutamate cyclase domain-containing protein [Reyranella soli]|uniref:Aspartate/glutamate/hydantoin racemase n=1 Tax=Reyranella soli TaxID=1230389 RepID=A0A512N708_9HYPH|nr:glutamate cyclase domain-containing protein [Reyranella soli]GEP54775.1 aspartate/glutamate/hydantoin racemase [Reyranella soli]
MSPRKSDAERIAAIEALVCRDVGRKTAELIAASSGELAAAGQALTRATSVGLITGFFVPRGEVAAPETDGPVGTALLAAALAACGVPARIAVDTPCAGAVRAAVAQVGEGVEVDEIAVEDRAGLEDLAARWRKAGISHAVAIERCGRSPDGRPRNMRGVDVSAWTAPLDDLFLGGPWRKLAVGDGGNEIGMGKLPDGLIARFVPNGASIACVTSCDHLVVAGVSNWGAYGLMAALAVLRPEWSPIIGRFLTAERDLAVTRATVDRAGAVDGVTARREATVDGFGPEIHGPLIDELGRIARGEAAD